MVLKIHGIRGSLSKMKGVSQHQKTASIALHIQPILMILLSKIVTAVKKGWIEHARMIKNKGQINCPTYPFRFWFNSLNPRKGTVNGKRAMVGNCVWHISISIIWSRTESIWRIKQWQAAVSFVIPTYDPGEVKDILFWLISEIPEMLDHKQYQEHHYCNTDNCNKEVFLGDGNQPNGDGSQDGNSDGASSKFATRGLTLIVFFVHFMFWAYLK